MQRWIIRSRTDIETYVRNTESAEFPALNEALVGEIQNADHPPYGEDWAEWLDANVEKLRDGIEDMTPSGS